MGATANADEVTDTAAPQPLLLVAAALRLLEVHGNMSGGNSQKELSRDNDDKEDVVLSKEDAYYRLCRARGRTLRTLACILAGLSLLPCGLGGFAIYRITSGTHASYSPWTIGVIICLATLGMAMLLALPILAVARLLRRYNFSDLMQSPEQNARGPEQIAHRRR